MPWHERHDAAEHVVLAERRAAGQTLAVAKEHRPAAAAPIRAPYAGVDALAGQAPAELNEKLPRASLSR
jgi:hypothetical protein